jgi:uncharacterized cofD-like protein
VVIERWARRWPRLKWLVPGMHVKRWVLLYVAGFVLAGLGIAALPEALGAGVWQRAALYLRELLPHPQIPVISLLVAGLACVVIAFIGLYRSLLSAFRRTGQGDVVDVVYRHRQRQRGPKVVAIGGGHGLNTLLRGLKEETDNITAIVTVADDGGSSGRLRRELGVLPPGDFRNCIAALSDAEGLMTQLFQYRFGDESGLGGHSFGNLYITAMAAITGSFESALAESGRVLAVRGRVMPSTLAEINLCAEVMQPLPAVAAGGATGAAAVDGATKADQPAAGHWEKVCGESRIGELTGRIAHVYLQPENVPAYPEAIRAVLEADLILIGPGSLYTSVLPNLLVPDLASAIVAARAPKVYICNVATQPGETAGYDVSSHVQALRQHVGNNMFHTVLANHTFSKVRPPGAGADWVHLPRPETVDYRLVTGDLVDYAYPWRHDPAKLAQAVMEFLKI